MMRDDKHVSVSTTDLHLFGKHPNGDIYHSGGCWCKPHPGHGYTDGNAQGTLYWWSRLVITESPETMPEVA